MEVTPQLLNEQEFREARRGYDMRDVDEFLERVAVGVARLQERLHETLQRTEAAELRARQLEAELAQVRSEVGNAAETDETLRRTLVLAQKTADAAIAEAEETAARTMATAQEEAGRMVSEAQEMAERTRTEAETAARRAGEEARRRSAEEAAQLEAVRDALNADVRALRRYLDDQRTRLRTTARDLQRLADDPTALKDHEPPSVSDATLPPAYRAEPEGAGPVETEPSTGDPAAAAAEVGADEHGAGEPFDEAADVPGWPETEGGLGGGAPEALSDPVVPAEQVPVVDDDGTRIDLFSDVDDDDADYFDDLRRAMHEPDEGVPPVEGGPALFDHAEEPPPVTGDDDAPGRPRFGRWR